MKYFKSSFEYLDNTRRMLCKFCSVNLYLSVNIINMNLKARFELRSDSTGILNQYIVVLINVICLGYNLLGDYYVCLQLIVKEECLWISVAISP